MAILGKVNGNAAEIQSPIQNTAGILQGGGVYASTTGIRSIRWQQEGMEYAVYGNVSLDVLARFVEALSDGPVEIPKPEEPLTQEPNPEEAQDEPTLKVPVDLEVEKGDQKNVMRALALEVGPGVCSSSFCKLANVSGGNTRRLSD